MVAAGKVRQGRPQSTPWRTEGKGRGDGEMRKERGAREGEGAASCGDRNSLVSAAAPVVRDPYPSDPPNRCLNSVT